MAQRPGAQAAAAAAAPIGVAAPAAMVRPAVMPEAYDGSGDWVEYQHYFEQCAQINGWPDQDKARFLAVRLRGSAQRYFATIPAARRANWQHLTADMAQRFLPPGTALQCKAQFKSRRRLTGESLATLADDLRKLVVRAYPNMPDPDRDELVRDQFIEALTPVALRVRLQENPPATVPAAVEMALHLERIWGFLDVPAGGGQRLVGPYEEPPAQQVVAAVTPPSATTETGELVKLLARLESRLSDLGTGRLGRFQAPARRRNPGVPPTCWECGQVGHIQRDCQAEQAIARPRGRTRVPSSQSRQPRPTGNDQ